MNSRGSRGSAGIGRGGRRGAARPVPASLAWLLVLVNAVSPLARAAPERPPLAASSASPEGAVTAPAGLAPFLRAADIGYPPRAVVLVGFKHERRLELYAGASPAALRFVRDYPVMGASGAIGPKLSEGDRQVPEGVYRLVGLNRDSRFRRSLELDYPNRFDREMAERDGRTGLGGDIFIHGGSASAGCLAIGDHFAEELFVLAADAGLANVTVVLTPWDFRVGPVGVAAALAGAPQWPEWIDALYVQIQTTLERLPPPRW